jgi:thiosulfate/3-mercaptopyruvate sulfurtransferase
VESGAPRSADPPPPSTTRRQFTAHANPQAWLTTEQLQETLRSPDDVLVDARAPQRFAGREEPLDPVAGHIPQALNHPFTLNLREDGRFLPRAELQRIWEQRLGGAQPSKLIAMCGSGVTACHNLLALEVAGLAGGRLYAGSWSEWIRDPQRPVASG